MLFCLLFFFFFSSRRRHTRCGRDWSSDMCSSDLVDLDLVAFLQEAAHLAKLDLVVALVGDGAELHFLDLDLLGLLLGLVGALLLLELELSEVHDLADRGIRIGLDLHQVEAFFLGHLQCFVARQYADHLTIGTDHAYAGHADLAVAAILLVLGANTRSPEMGIPGAPPGARRAGWDGFLTESGRDTTVRGGILPPAGRQRRPPASHPGPRRTGSGPPPPPPPARGPRPPAGRAPAAGCARGSCSPPSRCGYPILP